MAGARFSYGDFRRLEQASWQLDLRQCPPACLQALLAERIGQSHPDLAEQVAGLDTTSVQLLHAYLVRRRWDRKPLRH